MSMSHLKVMGFCSMGFGSSSDCCHVFTYICFWNFNANQSVVELCNSCADWAVKRSR